jgi:hypothetical protein
MQFNPSPPEKRKIFTAHVFWPAHLMDQLSKRMPGWKGYDSNLSKRMKRADTGRRQFITSPTIRPPMSEI